MSPAWQTSLMTVRSTKSILVTGSSGYVGQHLIATLARFGIAGNSRTNSNEVSKCKYEVYCGYNSLSTFEKDLEELCQSLTVHPSISKIETLLLDFHSDISSTIQDTCGTVDVIIHLAALSSPFYCQTHEDEAWKINVPIGLLELNAPLIYMSTDQVYEGTKQYYIEDDATYPVNLYGRTKLTFERVLTSTPLLTEEDLEHCTIPEYLLNKLQMLAPHSSSVILRSSLILGKPAPLLHGCAKGTFPSFLQFVESRLKSSTPTDYFTNEYRSMVHVEDVVTAILHFTRQALQDVSESSSVRTYNLGGSERVSRYDLALKIASHLQIDDSCVNGVDRLLEDGAILQSPSDISMNVEKLTKELKVDRLDGLDEIIKTTFGDRD